MTAKSLAGPEQPIPPFVNTGVTVMIAAMGLAVALIAVKEAMSPVPLAASPIEGVLFIQL